MLMALDVGEKRIGVALADNNIKIAVAHQTLLADGTETEQIARIVNHNAVTDIIVGYPRNQSGESTKQTDYAKAFADKLRPLGLPITFQDESLTSVHAEERLNAQKKPYTKADIDALAAALILQDYLEMH